MSEILIPSFIKDKIANCLVTNPNAAVRIGARCRVKQIEQDPKRWYVLEADGESFIDKQPPILLVTDFLFV